jgi:transposase
MKKAAINTTIQQAIHSPEMADSLASSSIDVTNIHDLFALLEQQNQVIEKKSSVIDEQKKRIAILEEYLRLERAKRFGPSSEKNLNQGELFNEAEDACGPESEEESAPQIDDIPATKKSGGRKGLSPSIPRHQVHISLSEEEKAGAIDTFYTVVKEELDIVPAKARVIEYLQEKAVFLDENQQRQIKVAEMPKHPLNKCIASVNLLVYIVIAKYCDGLSLYGLSTIVKRYGGDITRTSMANWVIRLALELQPLVNLMREHQLRYDYLQIDETPIQVLKEPDKSPTSKKWMWVTRGGPPDSPAIIFDYDPSRGKEVAARQVDGFAGYLQCDGMGSYDAIWHRKGLKQLGCLDHVRRKFKDAQKAITATKGKRELSKADVALGKIGAIYRLEREISNLNPEEKYAARQEFAIPLLNDLKAWLELNITSVVKGSLTYKAMYYTLNQWPKLIVYCEDGRLNISNALAENAIRPFAVGRKRWLFADTPKGAHASAIHYSLIESAKANGLEPEAYYRVVLEKLPYADTVEKLEELLPWNVKAQIAQSSIS